MRNRTARATMVEALVGSSAIVMATAPRVVAAQDATADVAPIEASAPPTAPALAGAGLETLKVATWNLEWLHRRSDTGTVRRTVADYERLAKYAARLDADIVAVQEVDGEAALRRVFDDAVYDYHVASQSGVQLTGFAYKSHLSVTKNPDYAALDVGDVRVGTDLTVEVNGQHVRLLSVHLKSACFDQPLTSSSACQKLGAQLPILEAWIDARAAAGEAFVVLGDFNRRMKTGEVFYSELDDADPPNADLTLVTDGRTSACWNGEFPEFIDHLALSKDAAPWLTPESFAQQLYDAADTAFKATLSDHCPVSIDLTPGATFPLEPAGAGSSTEPVQAGPTLAAPVKGNINSRGRKLYHLPNCPSYAETQIDEAAGERFFATEAEALTAGWQKAGNCP